ncbi:branched-chain amino acid ABC transporter permease [Sporolituus thermophilus]|uniref:branched-chain amino acid ABC transporter permease n=1 Tax=Sporolituus thermophilus TaxID=608505 RepID=UPI0014956CCB|nr:branched-chain amino acid ABC transporter permease [Sporolituus thermophilus]
MALPYLGIKTYYLHIAILSLINALLALGLNVIAGYTGQLSLAQAAFFGIGSYTTALLMLQQKISFWLAAPLGIACATLIAILIGIPTLRLKGPYFVISTLGFGEIVRLILLNWESVTRGPNGLPGIPAPDPISLGFTVLAFDTKVAAYYLNLTVLLLVLVVYSNTINSRVGRALRAIRNDQIAAEVMGINLTFYKVLAFAGGAALSGLAGALYAGYIRFISPDTFTLGEAINILVMMVLGGMGTIIGPILGSVIITYLLETMRILADYRLIIYGLLMFIIILYLPSGFAGLLTATGEKIGKFFVASEKPAPVCRGSAKEISEPVESEV